MRRGTTLLAGDLVKRAIRDGLLVRPEACARCGVACKPDGHHRNYLRPLEVEWLCRKCHSAANAERRRMDAQREFGQLGLASVTLAFKDGRIQTLGPDDVRDISGHFHMDYSITIEFALTIARGDEQITSKEGAA